MQRKDEINAKRAKLAELRRQREEREQRHKDGRRASALQEKADGGKNVARPSLDRNELDSFIDTLVGQRSSNEVTSPISGRSRPVSTSTSVQGIFESHEKAGASGLSSKYVTVSTQTQVEGTIPLEQEQPVETKPETYSKAVQTSNDWPGAPRRRSSELTTSDDETADGASISRRDLRRQKRDEELRRNLRQEIEDELRAVSIKEKDAKLLTSSTNYPLRDLTNEELDAVTSSDDFFEFVDWSSKVIEKALDEDYDVLVNYATDGQLHRPNTNGHDSFNDPDGVDNSVSNGKTRKLRQTIQFWDERTCKRRMISDIHFSYKYPELLLASYTKNVSAPHEPAGLVHVWNINLHSRPEFTFQNTSDILTARFSPFHPSLIIGGSYSGQVILWDTRSKSQLPVQKTPLTGAAGAGHAHPIYSLAIVGTQNANNIISCSTDGVVCGWTTEMLTIPQEFIELTTPPPTKLDDLSSTCLSFSQTDPTVFFTGTEEGTIFSCHRYDRADVKAGVDARLRYKGHVAPVMSLDCHPARGAIDLSDLVLSASLDWSVKLWKSKTATNASVPAVIKTGIGSSTTPSNAQEIRPLLDINRSDAVYDARWSPARPEIFATVDGGGNVDVWDLLNDPDSPTSHAQVQPNSSLHGSHSAVSLNKIGWDAKEGKRLAVGGAAGILTVFEVGNSLSGEHAKAEQWTGMKRLINRLDKP